MPRDGTKMATGSNQQSGSELAIDDPAFIRAFDAADGHAFTQLRSGAPQQVLVKFTAPYAVADGLIVRDINLALAHAANTEAANGLQGAAASIVFHIDFQGLHHPGGDPAAADFIARECGLIEDHGMQPRGAQSPRAGRSRGSTAYDQDIARIHSTSCTVSLVELL